MSNSLAVATVTSTMRWVIDRSLQTSHAGQVGGAAVTTLRPDELAGSGHQNSVGVNVYCYRATANHAWNLTDLPTRRSTGTLSDRPVAAIDLHYLITCYGDDEALEPQRLLGRTVLALAANSVLTRDAVAQARLAYGSGATAFLTASDLADEVELVKLSPTTLSTEELSKLWGMFGGSYQVSLSYLATVVLITADVSPVTPKPVLTRQVSVSPFGPSVLASVVTDPSDAAVTTGATLVLSGAGLGAGPVRIGPAELAAVPAESGTLRVALTPAVPAGIHGIQVVGRTPAGPGGEPPARVSRVSNALPLVVRPTVSVAGVDDDEITLAVVPPVRARQRVSVMLTRLSGGTPAAPDDVTVVLPPSADDAAPTSTVVIPRASAGDGRWLVRVQVDGADSLPEIVGTTFDSPALVLPPP